MEVGEILARLRRYTGRFPEAAIQAAIKRRSEIIPSLLKVLQRCADDLQATSNDGDRMDYTYAMFLLAQFREKKAYPLLCRFFSGLEGDEYWFCGDVVTEDLARLWASVFDGNLDPLVAIVENPRIDVYTRNAAARAFAILYLWGDVDRESIIGVFRRLILSPTVGQTPYLIGETVYLAGELHLRELHPQIKEAYKERPIDRRECPLSQIELLLSLPQEQVLSRLRDDWHYTKIDDTIAELRGWASFVH